MAQNKDIKIKKVRGDTIAFGVSITNLDQDLSSAYFSCKTDPDATGYIFQKSLSNGITKVETGKYRVRVAPEDTHDVEPGTYYYDLQIGLNGDIFTVMKGKLILESDITREAN